MFCARDGGISKTRTTLLVGHSEWKNWKKPTPLKCDFFAWKLIIGLINDDLCRFWPSGARWGARGAPEGFWGVRRTQNCQFPYGTKLSSEMLGFGPRQLVTLCFWYFRPNWGPWGQKKANLGQNRVCRKVLFPKNCHLKFCSYCTKIHVLDHISIWNIDFFGNPPKFFSRRLILWISTQDGQNRHVDPMMVQKGPNGPETLLTCIIHNYRSYWPALGPFRYPRGAKRAISAQSLKLLGPNFGSQKKSSEYRHVGCPESCNGMPCSYIAVADHIEHSRARFGP